MREVAADLLARRRRHLLDADHEYDLRALGLDRLHRLLHGGGAGGAGILDAGRGLEAQGIIGLEHEGGGEILGAEAGIEMAEHDLVDITGLDAGMGNRLAGHPHDHALDGLGIVLAEGHMGPAHNGRGH